MSLEPRNASPPTPPRRSHLNPLPLLCVLTSFLVGQLAAVPASGQLSVSPQGSSVVLSGMTAGGRVAVVGVTREERAYSGQGHLVEAVAVDADGDTRETVPLDFALGFKTLLVGIDLASGQTVISTPAGFTAQVATLPPGAYQVSVLDTVPTLTVPREWVKLLLVRPGVGAWGAEVREGSPHGPDEVGDGEAYVPWTEWQPLTADTPAAPGALITGDKLEVIAPDWFERWVGVTP